MSDVGCTAADTLFWQEATPTAGSAALVSDGARVSREAISTTELEYYAPRKVYVSQLERRTRRGGRTKCLEPHVVVNKHFPTSSCGAPLPRRTTPLPIDGATWMAWVLLGESTVHRTTAEEVRLKRPGWWVILRPRI